MLLKENTEEVFVSFQEKYMSTSILPLLVKFEAFTHVDIYRGICTFFSIYYEWIHYRTCMMLEVKDFHQISDCREFS